MNRRKFLSGLAKSPLIVPALSMTPMMVPEAKAQPAPKPEAEMPVCLVSVLLEDGYFESSAFDD